MKRVIKKNIRQIRAIEWIITWLTVLAFIVLILCIGFGIGGAIAKTGDPGVFENVFQSLFWICALLFVVALSLVKFTEPEEPLIFVVRKEEPEQEVKQE